MRYFGDFKLGYLFNFCTRIMYLNIPLNDPIPISVTVCSACLAWGEGYLIADLYQAVVSASHVRERFHSCSGGFNFPFQAELNKTVLFERVSGDESDCAFYLFAHNGCTSVTGTLASGSDK